MQLQDLALSATAQRARALGASLAPPCACYRASPLQPASGRRGPRGGPAIHDFAAPWVRARAAARREALSEARDRLGCSP